MFHSQSGRPRDEVARSILPKISAATGGDGASYFFSENLNCFLVAELILFLWRVVIVTVFGAGVNI